MLHILCIRCTVLFVVPIWGGWGGSQDLLVHHANLQAASAKLCNLRALQRQPHYIVVTRLMLVYILDENTALLHA